MRILAFSTELLKEIAKNERLDLSLIRMNWNNLLWGLREKKYQGALSSLRPYVFYLKEYSFSSLYLEAGPVFVLPKGSLITEIKQLIGKEIAVVQGSSAAVLLQKFPGIIIRSYLSIPQALQAVEKQEVDLAAIHLLIAQNFVRDLYPNILKIEGPPLDNEGLRLLTLDNENQELLSRFDEGLEQLKKDGTYEMLKQKWGLSPDGKIPNDLDLKAAAFLDGILDSHIGDEITL